jgi:hypothetical protein
VLKNLKGNKILNTSKEKVEETVGLGGNILNNCRSQSTGKELPV